MARNDRLGILLTLVSGTGTVLYGGVVVTDDSWRPGAAVAGFVLAVVAGIASARLVARRGWSLDGRANVPLPVIPVVLYGLGFVATRLLPGRVVDTFAGAFLSGVVGVCVGSVVAGFVLARRLVSPTAEQTPTD